MTFINKKPGPLGSVFYWLHACGGGDDNKDDDSCMPGTVGCECTIAQTCGVGLACEGNKCVAETGDTDSADGTQSEKNTDDSEEEGSDGEDDDDKNDTVDSEQDTYDSDHFANPDADCDPQPTNIALTADDEGWVGQCENRFGLQGVWYAYDDNDDGGASTIEIDFSDAASGKICTSGIAGEVQFELFSAYWGAGIGLNICETGGDDSEIITLGECTLFDERTNIIGFTITIEGEQLPADGSELRVQFKEDSRTESAYIVVEGPGTADYLFEDAEVGYAVAEGDTEVEGCHPELLEALQFQVSTIEGADTPFEFCVSEVKPILE